MMLKNIDQENGLVNGTRGVVLYFENNVSNSQSPSAFAPSFSPVLLLPRGSVLPRPFAAYTHTHTHTHTHALSCRNRKTPKQVPSETTRCVASWAARAQ